MCCLHRLPGTLTAALASPLAVLGLALLLLAPSQARAATPRALDNLVQTAVNGSYNSAQGTLTLHRVESSRTAAGAPAALVRTLALSKSFGEAFAGAEGAPLATLVVHDGASDGRRSHHLVRVRSPRFVQWSNSVTYAIELLNPASPPPAEIDRAFLVFAPGNLAAVTDPEPLLPPDDVAASDLVEAVSTETITGGTYEPKSNLLRLRGVEHVLLASGRLLRSATFAMADLAEQVEAAYRQSSIKPVAVLAWSGGSKDQQAVIRLEDFDFDAANSEVSYAISVLEASAPLPGSFDNASLTIPATISFGRGWPAHSACCSCDAKCSALWVLFAHCKTCLSPLGGDKCCKTCNLPAVPGDTCPQTSDGPALVSFNQKLILGFLSGKGTRELLVTSSADGQSFGSPVAVPNQASNRGPGMAAFGNIVVMGYRANDASNNLWATLSQDGVSFNGAFAVNGQQSPEPPAVAAFQGQVWMAYRANDSSNQIFLTSSPDGKTWSSALRPPGQTTLAKPALAVFQGRLVLAYLANDDTGDIALASTSDLKSWNVAMIPNQSAGDAPALAVFKNRLFVAYTADDPSNRLFVTSSADGLNFDQFATLTGQTTAEPPALAVFGDRLYLSYQANDSSNRLFVTSSADGQSFDRVIQLPGQ